jgi:subtilisin family serine protease
LNIAAVNMSLGGGQYHEACDAEPEKPLIDNLYAAGIATVISSGNDGFIDAIGGPACISSAVSVGATDKADWVADFSNSSQDLDLLAPGVAINSAVPGGSHEAWDGTSMAAPHVTGAFAVLKQAAPDAGVDAIQAALQDSGKPVMDNRNGITKRRIQVDQALTALDGSVPPPPPGSCGAVSADGFVEIGLNQSLNCDLSTSSEWELTDQNGNVYYAKGFHFPAPGGPLTISTVSQAFTTEIWFYDPASQQILDGGYGTYTADFAGDVFFLVTSLEIEASGPFTVAVEQATTGGESGGVLGGGGMPKFLIQR